MASEDMEFRSTQSSICYCFFYNAKSVLPAFIDGFLLKPRRTQTSNDDICRIPQDRHRTILKWNFPWAVKDYCFHGCHSCQFAFFAVSLVSLSLDDGPILALSAYYVMILWDDGVTRWGGGVGGSIPRDSLIGFQEMEFIIWVLRCGVY